jgi:hypothetical protein
MGTAVNLRSDLVLSPPKRPFRAITTLESSIYVRAMWLSVVCWFLFSSSGFQL